MFEYSQKVLSNLEANAQEITIEDLIEAMYKVFEDGDGRKRTVSDVDLYGDALVNLFACIRPSYEANYGDVSTLSDRGMRTYRPIIDRYLADIALQEKEIIRLAEEKRLLLKKQSEYQEAQAQKEALLAEIEALPRYSAPEIEQEIALMQSKKKDLEKNKQAFESARIYAESAAKEALEYEARKTAEETKIKGLERDNQKTREQLEQMMALRKKLEDVRDSEASNIAEAENQFRSIKIAWDTLRTRDVLSHQLSECRIRPAEFDSPQDIIRWMDSMGNIISSYVDFYREILCALDNK